MLINIPDNTTVCALIKFAETLGCQIRVVDGTVTMIDLNPPKQRPTECLSNKPVLTIIGGAIYDTDTNKPR